MAIHISENRGLALYKVQLGDSYTQINRHDDTSGQIRQKRHKDVTDSTITSYSGYMSPCILLNNIFRVVKTSRWSAVGPVRNQLVAIYFIIIRTFPCATVFYIFFFFHDPLSFARGPLRPEEKIIIITNRHKKRNYALYNV